MQFPGLRLLLAACGALGLALAAQAQTSNTLDTTEALQASQAVLGRQVGDHVLLDRQERPVRLADYRGKPLLVSFIYTGCFQVCPANTRALQETVQALQRKLAPDRFNIVSIGFNQPADTPQAMRAFAAQHRIDAPNWEFLSPAPASVDALTREFGFRYLATPAGFEHVLQVSVLDAQGRIARQLYGEASQPAQLLPMLQQLLAGQPLPPPRAVEVLVDKVLLLCSVYDPETGTYRVDYRLVWELAGGITFMLALLLYLLNEWRLRRAMRRAALQA